MVEAYLRGARLRGGYTCFAARTTDCNQPEDLACPSFVHSFILTLFFICQCSACLRDGWMEDGTEEINATSCCLRLWLAWVLSCKNQQRSLPDCPTFFYLSFLFSFFLFSCPPTSLHLLPAATTTTTTTTLDPVWSGLVWQGNVYFLMEWNGME